MRLRASPNIELKRLRDLAPAEREAFAELERDVEFYGLLVPRAPLTINLKSVPRRTAELFSRLATPASVAMTDDIVDLVLDGILEIETDDGFVSGADALSLLTPVRESAGARTALADLSREALLHAQDLATGDCGELTRALYFFNRIPLSPSWRSRLPNADAVLAHLGADRDPLRALLDREWVAHRIPEWLSWSPRAADDDRTASDVTYKLYISPRPERMRDAFEIVVRVLAMFGGVAFKIGDSAAGLLRPDKFVAYFATRAHLDEVATLLAGELAGCDAHGVPFTAAVGDDALLSWGIDPPDEERALQWVERDSWRFWIVKRLGAAMSIAKLARGAAAVEPWRFALERARRHGVDVDTWTPSPAFRSIA